MRAVKKGACRMVQWDSVEQLEQYQLHQRNDLPKLGTDSKLLAQFATLHRREKVLIWAAAWGCWGCCWHSGRRS